MLLADRTLDGIECCRIVLGCNPPRVGSIALEALGAAETQPTRDQRGIPVENAEQHLFMIAEQEYGLNAVAAIGPQPRDHLSRAGSAIDQIAEEDEQDLAPRPSGDLAVDLGQQPFEQVEPAVDVAHDICAKTSRARWRRLIRLHETENPHLSSPRRFLSDMPNERATKAVSLNIC